VHDESSPRAELREHLGDRRDELRRVDPDDLGACARGIRERAEDVEDGPSGELAAHRGGVSHRRVVGRSEEEAEAELVDGALDALRGLLEVEAERFEDVGRARRGGDRAVSVLGHARTGCRGHESRGSRDVEGASAVAAGPGGCRRGRRASG
jgi:hypothetical protein